MHFILLKYIHNIIRYMCFYKNWLNLPRSPLLRTIICRYTSFHIGTVWFSAHNSTMCTTLGRHFYHARK